MVRWTSWECLPGQGSCWTERVARLPASPFPVSRSELLLDREGCQVDIVEVPAMKGG
jgi:hypothetical protein